MAGTITIEQAVAEVRATLQRLQMRSARLNDEAFRVHARNGPVFALRHLVHGRSGRGART